MAKVSRTYLCSECGWSGGQWYGRCPSCGQFNTISEYHEPKLPKVLTSRRSRESAVEAAISRASHGPRNDVWANGKTIAREADTRSGSSSSSRTRSTSSLARGTSALSDRAQREGQYDENGFDRAPFDREAFEAQGQAGGLSEFGLENMSDAVPVTQGGVDKQEPRLHTGFSEFDRVLGGGIVPGEVALIAGEPGIGKSTLLLSTAGNIANANLTVLYISGEESLGQIRLRARRIGAMSDNLLLASTTDLGTALMLMEKYRPALAIIDSVQTITSEESDGISGGTSQVREVTRGVIEVSKALNIPSFVVGHVTKDGNIAGPRTLEHLVDVVCQFEGDTRTALRLLRAVKNRFGPTDEVGCFDMVDEGIEQVTDPSGLFISSDDQLTDGTCITFTMDGHRSMPIEIQALTTASVLPSPRRATNGVDANRIAMLVAVLYKHARIGLLNKDLYISTIAGAQAREPSCDLAICMALASAQSGVAIARTTACFGEVSLTGEIRAVPRLEQRLDEAQRLGFTQALIPVHQKLRNPGRYARLQLVRVSSVRDAVRKLSLRAARQKADFGGDSGDSSESGESAQSADARSTRAHSAGARPFTKASTSATEPDQWASREFSPNATPDFGGRAE